MATPFVNTWINRIENSIKYWSITYSAGPYPFVITPLPAPAVVNTNVLSHRITSCCPSPPKPAISFDHFPEPYYGNPDDDVQKTAVVLFYNPGPSGPDQLLGNLAPGSFHSNYLAHGENYFSMSSAFRFCSGTINKFIKPKTNQLNNLIGCMDEIPLNLNPLFMDLLPWHSDKFQGFIRKRFIDPGTKNEVWENMMFTAILNAKNTSVTHYVNTLKNGGSKIVLFCIGSYYQHVLTAIGFDDITHLIPIALPHAFFSKPGVISAYTDNKRIKVWRLNSSDLNSRIKDSDCTEDLSENLAGSDVYIINMWTTVRSMDIPQKICPVISHILHAI